MKALAVGKVRLLPGSAPLPCLTETIARQPDGDWRSPWKEECSPPLGTRWYCLPSAVGVPSSRHHLLLPLDSLAQITLLGVWQFHILYFGLWSFLEELIFRKGVRFLSVVVQSLCCVWLSATPWTAACQTSWSFSGLSLVLLLLSRFSRVRFCATP